MFQANPSVAPISMIITNLAAHAYAGELNLYETLANIVEKMPHFVRSERPRVPNPANPAEDYADKWSANPALERYFWQWHAQVRADLKRLPGFIAGDTLNEVIKRTFGVTLSEEESRQFAAGGARSAPAIVLTPAVMIPPSPPRPWGHDN